MIHRGWGGGPQAKVGSSIKFGVVVFKASILNSLGGPSAKVDLSAMFDVVVFKASILNSLGGPSAEVCLSAKFCVPVFKASILNSLGGPLAKVGSSAKFGVVVFKASILDSWGSICQSMFICQVLCTGIQGIYSQFTGGVHQPKKVCLPNMNTLLNLLLLHRGFFVLHTKDQLDSYPHR